VKKRRHELVMSRSTLQFIVLTLTFLLIANPVAFAAHTKLPKDVPGQVNALGTGHWAVVWLKDGHQLKGTIVGIDATSFSLDRGRRHGTKTLAFADVKKVQRNGLTTGDKVSIGVLAALVGGGIYFGLLLKDSGLTGSNTFSCSAGCFGLEQPRISPAQ
jgi:hypothetical protein